MRVIGNIHVIPVSYVNVYLIERGNKLILIDSGVEGSSKEIFQYIESINYRPEDLSLIIITHRHRDHTGGLRELLEKVDAKIVAHEAEVEGIKRSVGIDKVDILVKDNDEIEGLRVIHTPGHTPGHICLLDKDTQSLFIGDLVHEENGELHEIPHEYSDDPAKNREAIKKLAKIDFKHILPSHGEPILNNGKEALLNLINKLE